MFERKNISSTNPNVENKPYERVTEYKIGHTTYIVKTKFNFTGESLNELVSRLISKEIHKTE